MESQAGISELLQIRNEIEHQTEVANGCGITITSAQTNMALGGIRPRQRLALAD